MPKNQLQVVVKSVRQLTPRIREYVLAACDGLPLPAADAGAHIALHLPTDEGVLIRHYSLVSGGSSEGRGLYRIAVQRENRPRGSAWVHAHLAVGTRLAVSHPFNHFPLDWRDARSLLIAGGIGITPIVSMARSLAARRRPFNVVYTGRSAPDMAYLDEVRQLTGGQAQIHINDQQGGQSLDLAALLAAQTEGTCVYVCGPGAMIEATHRAAAALGWLPARVRSELFTPPPTGEEVGFELVLQASGKTMTVGPNRSILEAMRAAGLHPLFDCGRGECGLCPLPVLEADGPLQHRDRYLSDDEKVNGNTLCICVSRVCGPRLVLNA